MKRGIKRVGESKRGKMIKALALSEIIGFVLSSFAFAFLLGAVFIGSLGAVSAIDFGGRAVTHVDSAGNNYILDFGSKKVERWNGRVWVEDPPQAGFDSFVANKGFTSSALDSGFNPDAVENSFPASATTPVPGRRFVDAVNPSSIKVGEITKLPIPQDDKNYGITIYSFRQEKNGAFTPLDKNNNVITAKVGASSKELVGAYAKEDVVAAGANLGTQTSTTPKVYKTILGGETTNVAWGNLNEGLTYATAILTLTQLVGSFLPEKSGKTVKDIGLALSAGIMAGKSTAALWSAVDSGGKQPLGRWGTGVSWGVGIAVAYLTYASQHKETKEKTASIEFKCLPWSAPVYIDKSTRSNECNKCNLDSAKPCSEYRCKALGQTCKLINEGTGQERCIDSSPEDVNSPGIKPWTGILNEGYQYATIRDRPPGKPTGSPGEMTIKNPASTDGCLRAWTPFEFGIVTTDLGTSGSSIITQPGQCKIAFNHTKTFDDMEYWLGDNQLYVENHSQIISMPGTDLLNKLFQANGSLDVRNNGEYTLYIRCRDGNNNVNEDEFAVRFCIEKTPDVTAPLIKTTNPLTNSPVLYGVDNVSVNVYLNEPSKCKWSRENREYKDMENNMSCSNNIWEMNADSYYSCNALLTGTEDRKDNQFYFACEDLIGNTMTDSYSYKLIGTQPLTILKSLPEAGEKIGSSTNTAQVNLEVRTDNGYNNGEATCYYSQTDSNYIQMLETGNNVHKQAQDLGNGNYKYYFKCVDKGGNTAFNSTEFSVYIDKFAPLVLRAYSVEQKINIVTDEDSSCYYSTISCNYDINKNEGRQIMPPSTDNLREHWAELKSQVYYVKCVDKYLNQPLPSECSFILRPYGLVD